jgi:UDPglucose 6-dehydrogenase
MICFMVNKKQKGKNIAVVGLWHLGSVYATGLASLGHRVTAFDTNKKVISNFKKGIPPIFEPHLETYLKEYKDTLTFTTDPKDLAHKDYIFITHDVMVDEEDVSLLGDIEKLFRIVVDTISLHTIVVISSQIPIGTSRRLITMLEKKKKHNQVIYFPENLRLGTAYESLLKPERIVLGSDSAEAMVTFQRDITFSCSVVTMGLESAEMTKHALNTYLAVCVSLSSELGDIGERTGANLHDVVKAIKMDKRVSPFAPLNPGFGFAGATLGRDIQSLRAISRHHNYTPTMLSAVYTVNQNRIPVLMEKIKRIYPILRGKKIGLLGLTYKPNTNTLRRSMALHAATLLHKKGAVISAYDPVITKKVKEHSYIQIKKDIRNFAKGLDLILVMTDWKEFLTINPEDLGKSVAHKKIIDTKNFLPRDLYRKAGFTYVGFGVE